MMVETDYIDSLLHEPDDDSMVITEINSDIIRENILSQIKNSLNHQADYPNRDSYFSYFEQKYELLTQQFNKQQLTKEEYDGYLMDLNKDLNSVVRAIAEVYHLNITLGVLNDDNVEKKLEIIEALYNFFVISKDKLFSDFLYEYIIKNTESLLKNYQISKSVEENLSYKFIQTVIDNQYTCLIFNINKIINNIDVTGYNLISMIVEHDPEEHNNYIVGDLFKIKDVAVDNFATFKDDNISYILDYIKSSTSIINRAKGKLVKYYNGIAQSTTKKEDR